MEEFLMSEHVQTIILYACFGALLGNYLYWMGYGIVSGIKWIINKIKKHKTEEVTNEQDYNL